MNVQELSVEEYDALVDAGKIVAWGGQESKRLSREVQALRGTSKPRSLSSRQPDRSGELRDACRKIMAHKLKTKARRKPDFGAGRGQTWHA